MGRGSRPDCRRRWYATFAPFPDTCPRNQPALGQTYATVVYGEGRVSGEQMLTVGRGLRTTATAAVHKALFQLTHCQESVRLQAVAAANNLSVGSTSLTSTSQLSDIRSQGRARSARYTDGCLTAEPLVYVYNNRTYLAKQQNLVTSAQS